MPKYTIDLDGLREIRTRKLVVGEPGAVNRDSVDDYADLADDVYPEDARRGHKLSGVSDPHFRDAGSGEVNGGP